MLKAALVELGVIRSDAVAPGTPRAQRRRAARVRCAASTTCAGAPRRCLSPDGSAKTMRPPACAGPRKSAKRMAEAKLDVVGCGSMVVDLFYRTPRYHPRRRKNPARRRACRRRAIERTRVGGLVLNHLGWARVLGLETGIFGKMGDDRNGEFLRDGMDRLGIRHHLTTRRHRQLVRDDLCRCARAIARFTWRAARPPSLRPPRFAAATARFIRTRGPGLDRNFAAPAAHRYRASAFRARQFDPHRARRRRAALRRMSGARHPRRTRARAETCDLAQAAKAAARELAGARRAIR